MILSCVVPQECVRDTLSPVSISLDFVQVNSESSQAVLNVDSRRQLHLEVRGLLHRCDGILRWRLATGTCSS